MAAQLGLLGEGVVALAAAEGSLPAVGPQVTLQVPWGTVRELVNRRRFSYLPCVKSHALVSLSPAVSVLLVDFHCAIN